MNFKNHDIARFMQPIAPIFAPGRHRAALLFIGIVTIWSLYQSAAGRNTAPTGIQIEVCGQTGVLTPENR